MDQHNISKWMLDSGMDETGCFNSIYVTRLYVDPLVQKFWDITMKLAGCPRCKPFRHVILIIPVVSRDQFSVRIPAQLQAWHGRYQRSEWYFFAIEIIELYLQCPWTYIYIYHRSQILRHAWHAKNASAEVLGARIKENWEEVLTIPNDPKSPNQSTAAYFRIVSHYTWFMMRF
jgi:hypothetical protein